jgi:hypothetical protein
MKSIRKEILVIISAIPLLLMLEGFSNGLFYKISKYLNASNYYGGVALWFGESVLPAIIIGYLITYFLSPRSKRACLIVGIIWFLATKVFFLRPFINPNLGYSQFVVGVLEAYGPKAIGALSILTVGCIGDRYLTRLKPNNANEADVRS